MLIKFKNFETINENLAKARVSFEVDGQPILGLISKGYLARLLHVPDEKIQSTVAYQMVPKELKDLFDISLTPKSKKENVPVKMPKTDTKKKKK